MEFQATPSKHGTGRGRVVVDKDWGRSIRLSLTLEFRFYSATRVGAYNPTRHAMVQDNKAREASIATSSILL